ncbi:MAG: hypothetical protein AAGC67_16130 [Myxococcota bacterium]
MVARTSRRTRIGGTLVALLLMGGAALAGAATGSPATPHEPIEFWFIEPNEGDAAGGHAAVRIGEIVFHVQRRPDGLLIDRRTPRLRFEQDYRDRGNRGIQAVPLDLDPEARARLRETLSQRFYDRRARMTRLDGLEREAAWLEATLGSGVASVDVPGAGWLAGDAAGCDPDAAGPLEGFRREVAQRLGPAWLDARFAELERRVEIGLERMFSSRGAAALPGLVEAVQAREALATLRGCRRLAAGRIIDVPNAAPLDARDVAHLQARARELESRLHALLTSRRSDTGLAILLALARWQAIEDTIETGRWKTLDPFEEADGPARVPESGLPAPWRIRLEEASLDRLAARLVALASGTGPLEARLADVETETHRLRHLRAHTRHASADPRALGTATPDLRYAARSVVLSGTPKPTKAPARLDLVRARAQEMRRTLSSDLRYSLWTRNCVTELTSLLPDAARPGWRPLGFIPVVASRDVERRLSAGARRHLPSARLARLAARGSDAPGRWREWSPLTSRTYRPHGEDSAFLFFTRERGPTRPLLGVGNLVYGAGHAIVGLVSAPVDRGARFQRGLRGIVMSVPELLFFNVRQGSYPIAPPALDEASRTRASVVDASRRR